MVVILHTSATNFTIISFSVQGSWKPEMCGNFLNSTIRKTILLGSLCFLSQWNTVFFFNPQPRKQRLSPWLDSRHYRQDVPPLGIPLGPSYQPTWEPASLSQSELKAVQKTVVCFVSLRPTVLGPFDYKSLWLMTALMGGCTKERTCMQRYPFEYWACHRTDTVTRHSALEKQLLAHYWVLVKIECLPMWLWGLQPDVPIFV